jgi:hypothetical protein
MPVILKIVTPRLEDVRAFAHRLHERGEAFGWDAEYHPQRADALLDSKRVYSNSVRTRREHAFVRPGRHVGVPTPLQLILNTPILK